MQPLPSATPVRVVIVDSDRHLQQSLADCLKLAGVDVVGVAGDARTAHELITRTRPGVLLIDPRLPELSDGERLLDHVAEHEPSPRVVVMAWSDRLERPSLLARAAAVVSKRSDPDAFVTATLSACGCEV